MTDSADFADRIRERFPEGLTAIIAVGGTRTTYILENNRKVQEPGRIDYGRYGSNMLSRVQDLIHEFFSLGGQNLIIPVLSYQSVQFERGAEYAELTAQIARELTSGQWVEFYRAELVDPYFAGIDTLLRFPDRPSYYALGEECRRFNSEWPYEQGRHKIIWEIAPIPLYSIWQAGSVLGHERADQLEEDLEAAPDLQAVHDTLYRYYSLAVYGVELPTPNLYIGSNRNGDMKLRAMLPIALLCGGPFRMFFTPYPTFFLKRETLVAILEDLAFGQRLHSTRLDYSGKVTQELLEAEYNRVQLLSSDPHSTLGLLRTNPTSGDE